MSPQKKIILFYKNLTNRGGAELLILKEYKYFKQFKHDVKILTYTFNEDALFAETLNLNDLINLDSSNNFANWFKLLIYTSKNKNALYLVSSGKIEFFLISLFIKIKYSAHLHQPLFMSSRDFDKYSVLLRHGYDVLIKNNPLQGHFENVRKKIGYLRLFKINLQAILTILSYKKSHKTFVLSHYSRKEKKILFGIDSIVERGAIEGEIFNHKAKEVLTQFSKVKFKFLTICRLDNTKRIDVLIKSLSKFQLHEQDFVLVIAGNGPEKHYFEKLVTEHNLTQKIFFTGFIPEKVKFDYLCWPDLFISIDWADYTITTIEALALGTKCLVSREREIENSIIDSGLVFFTNPNVNDTCTRITEITKTVKNNKTVDLPLLFKNYRWDIYCKKLLRHMSD